MEIYYVVYIKGEVVTDCLNAILCLIKPNVKHPAHITVRGPYEEEIDVESFNKKLWRIPLILDSVGRFTNPGQHVVFLACNAPKLERIWWKPNYSFVPHLTLYNGTSQEQADEIFSLASQYTYQLYFKATKLEPLIIGGEQSSPLSVNFNENNISVIAQEHVSRETMAGLSHHQRLNAIGTLLQCLSCISHGYPYNTATLTWRSWEAFWKYEI